MKFIKYLLLFVMCMCAINNGNAQGIGPQYILNDESKRDQKTGFDGSKLSFESIQILATQQKVAYNLYFDCYLTTGESVRIRYDEKERLKKINWAMPIRMLVLDEVSSIEIPIFLYGFRGIASCMDCDWVISDITQINENEGILNGMHILIQHGGILMIAPCLFSIEGDNWQN